MHYWLVGWLCREFAFLGVLEAVANVTMEIVLSGGNLVCLCFSQTSLG